ncbi:hypothetical protein [Mucilaginibacter kameinonensis]|uniref:hypothetical protein n=1 Tax=Mucilaginibacter kameinonensis TaxID=452286 RepID=UPI000EF788C7|nr:hypothetical protein [Mucilaginibacter kameinonensis]
MKTKEQEMPVNNLENRELSHLLNLLNGFDFLNAVWQCDCHCELVINHQGAQTTLWLKHDEEHGFYKLYCSLPEESFRGEAHKFKCLSEIANYISLSNQEYPEFAIHLQIMADDIKV